MKTLVKLMGLAMGLVMVSCSGYDDEFILEPQQPQQQNNDPKPDDNNKNDDDEWATVMDGYFTMENGYIDSYIPVRINGKEKEYHVNFLFKATLGNDIYRCFSEKNAARNRFVRLHDVDPRDTEYGEKYANEENDTIYTKTSTQQYEASCYNRTLSFTEGIACRYINGKPENFLMPVIKVSDSGSSSKTTEIVRNDSIFDREEITDSVIINFIDQEAPLRDDLKPMVVRAKTVIDYFIGMKEKETENMPEPTFRVEGEILYISTRTASPIFIGGSKEQANWYEISNVKTTVKTYVVVNGQKQEEYNNSELADVNWQSAVYDAGYTNKWVPANINMDATGWTYVLQFSNGEHRGLTVPMNAALISSLKSFQKDNNAKQTPFLTQGFVKRTFSDGDFYTVNGLYPYTVAAE